MITAGIIGCGSIGATKPDNIDSPYTKHSLTHTHAIYKNKNIKLEWVNDYDHDKGKESAEKWGTKYVDPKSNPVDIIVVATPTETHLETIEEICLGKKIINKDEDGNPIITYRKLYDYKPKIIVIEKPVGMNIHETTRIHFLTNQKGIKLIINYTRRWSTMLSGIVSMIQKEELQNTIFQYTRGFIRDGSHAIDMLNWICGSFENGKLLTHKIIDYDESDPTYAVILKHTNCPLSLMIPCDGREFDVFELIVNTKKAKWFFTEHFRKIYRVEAKTESLYDNTYKSMPDMLKHHTCYLTKIEDALDELYFYVSTYLNYGVDSNKYTNVFEPACGIREALMVQNVFERLFTQQRIDEIAKGE